MSKKINPKIEKNRAIIEKHLLEVIDKGDKVVDDILGKLYGGPIGLVLNPLAKRLKDYLLLDKIKERLINELGVVLDCASELDGSNKKSEISDFEKYLENSEVWVRCKEKHEKRGEIKGVLYDAFEEEILTAVKLLNSYGDGWPNLLKNAFEREEAEKVLVGHYEFVDVLVRYIKLKDSPIKVPRIVKREVLRILNGLYTWAKDYANENINNIYGGVAEWEKVLERMPKASMKT